MTFTNGTSNRHSRTHAIARRLQTSRSYLEIEASNAHLFSLSSKIKALQELREADCKKHPIRWTLIEAEAGKAESVSLEFGGPRLQQRA